MQNFNYLFAGYSAIFILLGLYFFVLGMKISDLEKRVEALDENNED